MSLVKHLDWFGSHIDAAAPFDGDVTASVIPYDEDREMLDFVNVGVDICGAIIMLHNKGELPKDLSEHIIDKIKLQKSLMEAFTNYVNRRRNF